MSLRASEAMTCEEGRGLKSPLAEAVRPQRMIR